MEQNQNRKFYELIQDNKIFFERPESYRPEKMVSNEQNIDYLGNVFNELHNDKKKYKIKDGIESNVSFNKFNLSESSSFLDGKKIMLRFEYPLGFGNIAHVFDKNIVLGKSCLEKLYGLMETYYGIGEDLFSIEKIKINGSCDTHNITHFNAKKILIFNNYNNDILDIEDFDKSSIADKTEKLKKIFNGEIDSEDYKVVDYYEDGVKFGFENIIYSNMYFETDYKIGAETMYNVIGIDKNGKFSYVDPDEIEITGLYIEGKLNVGEFITRNIDEGSQLEKFVKDEVVALVSTSFDKFMNIFKPSYFGDLRIDSSNEKSMKGKIFMIIRSIYNLVYKIGNKCKSLIYSGKLVRAQDLFTLHEDCIKYMKLYDKIEQCREGTKTKIAYSSVLILLSTNEYLGKLVSDKNYAISQIMEFYKFLQETGFKYVKKNEVKQIVNLKSDVIAKIYELCIALKGLHDDFYFNANMGKFLSLNLQKSDIENQYKKIKEELLSANQYLEMIKNSNKFLSEEEINKAKSKMNNFTNINKNVENINNESGKFTSNNASNINVNELNQAQNNVNLMNSNLNENVNKVNDILNKQEYIHNFMKDRKKMLEKMGDPYKNLKIKNNLTIIMELLNKYNELLNSNQDVNEEYYNETVENLEKNGNLNWGFYKRRMDAVDAQYEENMKSIAKENGDMIMKFLNENPNFNNYNKLIFYLMIDVSAKINFYEYYISLMEKKGYSEKSMQILKKKNFTVTFGESMVLINIQVNYNNTINVASFNVDLKDEKIMIGREFKDKIGFELIFDKKKNLTNTKIEIIDELKFLANDFNSGICSAVLSEQPNDQKNIDENVFINWVKSYAEYDTVRLLYAEFEKRHVLDNDNNSYYSILNNFNENLLKFSSDLDGKYDEIKSKKIKYASDLIQVLLKANKKSITLSGVPLDLIELDKILNQNDGYDVIKDKIELISIRESKKIKYNFEDLGIKTSSLGIENERMFEEIWILRKKTDRIYIEGAKFLDFGNLSKDYVNPDENVRREFVNEKIRKDIGYKKSWIGATDAIYTFNENGANYLNNYEISRLRLIKQKQNENLENEDDLGMEKNINVGDDGEKVNKIIEDFEKKDNEQFFGSVEKTFELSKDDTDKINKNVGDNKIENDADLVKKIVTDKIKINFNTKTNLKKYIVEQEKNHKNHVLNNKKNISAVYQVVNN